MDDRFSREMRDSLISVLSADRLAHTVVIESDSKSLRDEAALFLSAYAVCKEQNRPCLSCPACKKALSKIHPDIMVPELSGKLRQVNMDSAREIIRQASIIPNEADTRVFIFYDADKTLPIATQNALLKLIEEPPSSILFLFTVKKSSALLPTVRSRAQIITLKGAQEDDEFTAQAAHNIISGIVSLYEKDLLTALDVFSVKENKEKFPFVMRSVTESLRQALAALCGAQTENEDALTLAKKLTKEEIISMTEITDDAVLKSQTNINMTLLCTWLCTQYRRILWQK